MPNARNEPTDVVCGSVNVKDGSGGYTGPMPFVYLVALNQATVAEGEERYDIMVRNLCIGFPTRG